MPGTFVAIGRNGPASRQPGFMSKVSIWLAPPFIQSRMQCLLRLRASAAIVCEWNRPPKLPTARPVVVARVPFRKARRHTCSAGLQCGFMGFLPTPTGCNPWACISVIEPKFATAQQHPDRLLDQRVGFLGVRGQVFDKTLPLLLSWKAGEHAEVKLIDPLFPGGRGA